MPGRIPNWDKQPGRRWKNRKTGDELLIPRLFGRNRTSYYLVELQFNVGGVKRLSAFSSAEEAVSYARAWMRRHKNSVTPSYIWDEIKRI